MKARLPQGFGGGPGNMQQMIRQAQKIQEDMAKKSEELEAMETTITSGGGAVEVVITGKKVIKSLTIKPEVVDPEDIEMLQDLIMAGVNEAIRTVEEVANKEMEKISGGLNVPGMF
ncbi:YbaB/EbfC family nucleoid-associated protein [Hydrogenoanaerobacterium sp.]|uniref:YbaB/EbfC family nucleoid-associated protein n=1 Tax=Hydrogenoanaerobacterium sp. TaxID=2953763 RepID=UPI0028A0E83D|nr:YbaB/EbfC family nucleoid-associated protein [Hydrogenoanaerobacterium sp.]